MSSLERQPPLKVFLVDDEPLALKRLSRLLQATGRVEIVGSATDPLEAVAYLTREPVDVLFLDIQMPGMNGFEMLARLPDEPVVIFTTAFDQYALRAFEVNSIDYLLKPVEAQQLERALKKVEKMRGSSRQPEWRKMVEELAAALHTKQARFPDRIASRLGERTQFVELAHVTHFLAENKLTYAVTPAKRYIVDYSISELEQRLDPKGFVRIHRSILLNAAYVQEIHQWFEGRVLVRLKDEKRTELTVARDRVRALKDHLGF
jgi:two-component system LytT family response regulator